MPTINFKKKQIYTRGVVKKKRDSAKKRGGDGPGVWCDQKQSVDAE